MVSIALRCEREGVGADIKVCAGCQVREVNELSVVLLVSSVRV